MHFHPKMFPQQGAFLTHADAYSFSPLEAAPVQEWSHSSWRAAWNPHGSELFEEPQMGAGLATAQARAGTLGTHREIARESLQMLAWHKTESLHFETSAVPLNSPTSSFPVISYTACSSALKAVLPTPLLQISCFNKDAGAELSYFASGSDSDMKIFKSWASA